MIAIVGFRNINTLRPQQNGWHFVDSIFKYNILNHYICILIVILLSCVPKSPIDKDS